MKKRLAAKIPIPETANGVLREVAVCYGISPWALTLLLRAGQQFSTVELQVVEELLRLVDQGVPADRREALSRGVARALASIPEPSGDDPLAEVDTPLDTEEAAASVAFAEMEAGATRLEILRDSIGVNEVAQLTGRSRQAIERLRRAGRLLALRFGAQWRYPRWQLDPDAPGGIVPGIDAVLGRLALSPVGTAVWLLTPKEQLGGVAPIELLRRRRPERALELALEQGWMP